MKTIELKSMDWMRKNIHLYFSNNIDERMPWAWTYNRLSDNQKNELVNIIKEIK